MIVVVSKKYLDIELVSEKYRWYCGMIYFLKNIVK
jgi:hypothetical protein